MWAHSFKLLSGYNSTGCPTSLEPIRIFLIFLIFIYRLKLKVKRLKMALTLDERVEILLLSGRQGWTQSQVADEFNATHPELQTVVLLSIPICWEQNPHKHGKAAEKMRSVGVNIYSIHCE
jgi:hypothetical protein